MQGRRAEKGFTLIELVLVLLLMAAITAIGVPSFRSLYVTSEMQRVSSEFLNTLRYAQQRAILERTPVQVIIDVENSTFWVPVEEEPDRRHYRSRSRRQRSSRRYESNRARNVRFERAQQSRLPEDFIFEFVYNVQEDEEYFRDEAPVAFMPDGSAVPMFITILRLADDPEDERRLFIKTEPATGRILMHEGRTEEEGALFYEGELNQRGWN